MHIAIEALGIDLVGGPRTHTLNFLNALLHLDQENEYTLYLSRHESLSPHRAAVRQVVIGHRSPLLQRLWAHAVLPSSLRWIRADLVHHAKGLACFGSPCPTVATIYDLTMLQHPELFPRADFWYWRYVQPRALRRAAEIIAISQTTAADIQRYYGIPSQRTAVIYSSISPRFGPAAEIQPIRKFGISGDFILHVGSISRKKNLSTLVRAFDRLRRRGFEGQLVLAGRLYHRGHDGELAATVAETGRSSEIIFTGPLNEDDLLALYRSAAVVAFPSLHEGFGIVPVEAMACGAPVVASAGGALAEVIGDAGWLLQDARDDAELAAALDQLIRDLGLRARLIASGLRRAARFAPSVAAGQTLDLYRRATLVKENV